MRPRTGSSPTCCKKCQCRARASQHDSPNRQRFNSFLDTCNGAAQRRRALRLRLHRPNGLIVLRKLAGLLALWLVLLALALSTGWNAVWLLVYSLGLLVAGSAVWANWNVAGLELRRRHRARRVQVGDTFVEQVVLEADTGPGQLLTTCSTKGSPTRAEEHTSALQAQAHTVCLPLHEKKKGWP